MAKQRAPKRPAKKKTGRPSKLDPAIQDSLTKLIARGHYATTACALAGLGESTYFKWMELGEDHLEVRGGRRVLVRARAPFKEFREAIEKAKAQAQMLHMEAIRDAAFEVIPGATPESQKVRSKNWTASAWYLERTAPNLFARRDVVHTPKEQQPQKPGETPGKRRVVFGGRYRPDGNLQTSAPSPAAPDGESK